jgi:hypothetical protein
MKFSKEIRGNMSAVLFTIMFSKSDREMNPDHRCENQEYKFLLHNVN